MTTFIVMAPPDVPLPVSREADADRLVFVPDRFSIPAFAFSLIWIVFHRMWLVLLAYLTVTLVLELTALAIGDLAPAIAAFAVSLAFAFEAQSLRRWSLERKGYRVAGMVCGSDQEEAELRFFRSVGQAVRTPAPDVPDEPGPRRFALPAGITPRIGTEHVVGMTLGRGQRR